MTHVILLDRYLNQYGNDQYAISDFGTPAYCRGRKTHDGTTFPAAKSNYVVGPTEAKTMNGPSGSSDVGRIVELTVIAGGGS